VARGTRPHQQDHPPARGVPGALARRASSPARRHARTRPTDGGVAMPTFTFKAMDVAGVSANGEVEAVSKQDVAEQLKQRGLIVLDIASKYRSKELNLEFFSRVKADDMAIMT